MLSETARYAYLNTRVSVFSEQLLHAEEQERLFSRGLDHIDDLLLDAGLIKFGGELPRDADDLEQNLISLLINEANILSLGLDGAARGLLVHWMRRFEMINLKILIRAKLSDTPPAQILGNLVDLGPLTGIPLEDLINSDNINEFMWRLESTAYGAMALQAKRAYEEKQSLFAVEAVLDSRYFADLARRVYSLRGNDQKYSRRIVGALLDQLNLVWLMRFRLDYHLDPPQAYFLLSGGGHRLGRDKLLELAQLDTFEQFLNSLPNDLGELLAGSKTIGDIESFMVRETHRIASHVLRSTSFNVARAFAYLYLREQQAQLIHIAVKGKLLRLDDDLVHACGFPHQDRGKPDSDTHEWDNLH